MKLKNMITSLVLMGFLGGVSMPAIAATKKDDSTDKAPKKTTTKKPAATKKAVPKKKTEAKPKAPKKTAPAPKKVAKPKAAPKEAATKKAATKKQSETKRSATSVEKVNVSEVQPETESSPTVQTLPDNVLTIDAGEDQGWQENGPEILKNGLLQLPQYWIDRLPPVDHPGVATGQPIAAESVSLSIQDPQSREKAVVGSIAGVSMIAMASGWKRVAA